ncbi:hypothetical protein [Paenibacillus harenae]|uniref:DUF3800 domain-containing protein n=1 Tax=Paenibacillus harenae TaxID=306543 RepID=A0ABT9U6L6_PAEHA|nr:hypothetical protein [Paenibacillus harenae]MDQ0114340.1 hypothetical protein [Paenibacillus harenae]
MTAEIGVLNTIGVALAADSAVTIGSKKIFNSADKLFSLSKHHPIGIMVYGNANFMGVPWETIIKMYRKQLQDNCFDTFQEYCDDFFSFFINEQRFIDKEYEKVMIREKFSKFMRPFLSIVNDTLTEIFQNRKPSITNVQDVIFGEADHFARLYSNVKFSEGFNDAFINTFSTEHSDVVLQVTDQYVNVSIDQDTFLRFILIASSLVSKDIMNDEDTGIVFAGFGESEIFPSLKSYMVEGVYDGVLKYKEHEDVKISATNTACIVPFAQQEMVHSFLTGIEPDLKKEIRHMFDTMVNSYPEIADTVLEGAVSDDQKQEIRTIGRSMVDDFNAALQEMIERKYSDPIIGTVSALPKEELAAMAEALVNLTSIKRKMSNQMETVGGPIDVAVISKGDGFIWIKRKHYFSPDLNHSYFNNYMER